MPSSASRQHVRGEAKCTRNTCPCQPGSRFPHFTFLAGRALQRLFATHSSLACLPSTDTDESAYIAHPVFLKRDLMHGFECARRPIHYWLREGRERLRPGAANLRNSARLCPLHEISVACSQGCPRLILCVACMSILGIRSVGPAQIATVSRAHPIPVDSDWSI